MCIYIYFCRDKILKRGLCGDFEAIMSIVVVVVVMVVVVVVVVQKYFQESWIVMLSNFF
jgi:ABC-type glycerol-3-phosphate transport system permease component